MRSLGQLLALLLLSNVACKEPPSTTTSEDRPDPTVPASESALDRVARAVEQAPAPRRPVMAAAALNEAGRERLSPALVGVLEQWPQVDSSLRALLAAEAMTTPPLFDTLQAVCQGNAPEVVKNTAMVAPDQKTSILWDGCKLQRFELIDAAEARTSGVGELLLGFVAFEELRARGGPTPSERALLRALMVGSGSQPPP